jgi:hypothetical protein
LSITICKQHYQTIKDHAVILQEHEEHTMILAFLKGIGANFKRICTFDSFKHQDYLDYRNQVFPYLRNKALLLVLTLYNSIQDIYHNHMKDIYPNILDKIEALFSSFTNHVPIVDELLEYISYLTSNKCYSHLQAFFKTSGIQNLIELSILTELEIDLLTSIPSILPELFPLLDDDYNFILQLHALMNSFTETYHDSTQYHVFTLQMHDAFQVFLPTSKKSDVSLPSTFELVIA